MGQIPKVVIDSNVFISAFGWDGKPEDVLRLVEQRHVINHATEEILEEIKRVIAYPKLKFPQSLQVKILEFVLFHSRFMKAAESIAAVSDDPDDNKFIECAVSADAGFIITGDPHLLAVNPFRDIRILTPAEFLANIGD